MESAVARLKQFRSQTAQGIPSVVEPPILEHYAHENTNNEPTPGSGHGPTPQQIVHSRAWNEECRAGFTGMSGKSTKIVDSVLGNSLSEADVPQHKDSPASSPSALRQTNPASHPNDAATGPRQNTAVTLSKAGKRRGRPPGSKNRERPTIPNPQTMSNCDQHPLVPKPSNAQKVKKDATPDQKLRSANISEAMKASWARRRENGSASSGHGRLSEGAVLEKRSVENVSGQSHVDPREATFQGTQRQLFKGQHAIRTGSGLKFSGPVSRRSSATEGPRDYTTLPNAARIASNVEDVTRLPDTSGGPELGDPPLICKGDPGLITVFRTCVYPTAVASIDRYRDTVLSSESLGSICKQVAKDTISAKFVAFLQDTQYKLDRPQRKLIRKYVKANFAVAANSAIKKFQIKMLESQFLHQQQRIGYKNLPAANNVDGHAPGLGNPASCRKELNHGPTEKAPKAEDDDYINHNAEVTARFETLDEKEALPGYSEPNDGSSSMEPYVKASKIPVPRRCTSCRTRHIKCVPLSTGCEACHKYGKSCTFRRVDGGHNMFFSSQENALASRQGRSISHVIKEDNELSCQRRFKSVPMSQGPGLRIRPALVGTEPSDHGQSSDKSGHRSRSPTEIVNERAAEADISNLHQQIKERLGQPSQESFTQIVKAILHGSELLRVCRKKKSIRHFLADLVNSSIPFSDKPKIAKPRYKAETRLQKSKHMIASLLQDRELGTEGFKRPIANQAHICPGNPCLDSGLQDAVSSKIAEDIRPWRSWKGASSDVVAVAWAPDSLSYAAGAAAQSDDMDLQYNRPNNLLFGQLKLNSICELPDHRIDRPRPETIESGPNSSQAVYDACDPVVYKTITSVQFSPSGSFLYTASHDKTAKIWDVSGRGLPSCVTTLPHHAAVTSLEVSSHYSGVFATAAKVIDDSIRVYQSVQVELPDAELSVGTPQARYQFTTLSSLRAMKHRSQFMYPECIRWGLAPGSRHLLLGGFQQWTDQDFTAARQGDVCLWDVYSGMSLPVRPHASAIFAAAWHPRENVFVTGGAPGTGTLSYPRTTQSVARIYDARHTAIFTAELECPALDMQDVTFHPFSDYITAGCTDGTTYVWDRRVPDYILHRLTHGNPLQELPPNEEAIPYVKHRERVDAGVMLSLWGQGASLFYTGSSDGVVKAWDILRAPEDVWVKDVAQLPAGVQSGALSPDGMNMLVGDAVGGVHVLSAAPLGCSAALDVDGTGYHPDPITFVPATNHDNNHVSKEGTEGIDEVDQFLRSGQLVIHPSFGAGKGPKYREPYYAHYARWSNLTTRYVELQPEIDQKQAFNADGVEQTENSANIRNVIKARQEHMTAQRKRSKPLEVSLGSPTPFVANRRSGLTLPGPLKMASSNLAHSSVRTSKTTHTAPKTSSSAKPPSNFIDLETYISPSQVSSKKRRRDSNDSSPCKSTAKRVKAECSPSIVYRVSKSLNPRTEVVDLTGDDVDSAEVNFTKTSSSGLPERQPRPYTVNPTTKNEERPKRGEADGKGELEENLLSYEEWVEEDYWWPE
ncbi:MAG: hypothetical protein Q9176_001488 [Flavoplaca citrina]